MIMAFGAGWSTAGEAPVVPAAHRKAACTQCHTGGALATATQAARTAARCLGCHDTRDLVRGAGSVVHGRPGQDCTRCHSFHTPSRVATPDGQMAQDTPSMESGHCQGCHGREGRLERITPAHRIAAGLYHTAGGSLAGETPSASCLYCHDSGSSSPWRNATDAERAFNPHASHPVGVAVVPGRGNAVDHISWDPDPRLPLFNGRMECQSCHLLTAGTPYDLIAYENAYDLCLGCHTHEPGPGRGGRADFLATIGGR